MFLFRRKTKDESITDQQGRSMLEMLGVLVIIGVLGIMAFIGYKVAMKRYQANQIIDVANKYAAVLFMGKRSNEAVEDMKIFYKIPSVQESGLTLFGATINTPQTNQIAPNSVILTIIFDEDHICRMVASTLGSSCAVVENAETSSKTASVTHSFPQS